MPKSTEIEQVAVLHGRYRTTRPTGSGDMLPALLAVIAGMVDLLSFTGFGGVFTAHVTGNIVVLAAVATGNHAPNLILGLVVITFMVTVATVRLALSGGEGPAGRPSRGVLAAQALLLLGVLVVCVSTDATLHPHAVAAWVSVMLAAAAMGSQNALLHLQVAGSPSTAVMTGNLASAVIAGLDACSRDLKRRAAGRAHFFKTGALLLSFGFGCILAAAAFRIDRNWAWTLPTLVAWIVAARFWKQ